MCKREGGKGMRELEGKAAGTSEHLYHTTAPGWQIGATPTPHAGTRAGGKLVTGPLNRMA